jgi:hypothetical protein
LPADDDEETSAEPREWGRRANQRVWALLADGAAALRHAQRCWAITEAEGFEDFDAAYACEAFARAYTVTGDSAAATDWHERAATAGALIADDEDRQIFEADLATA